jgi:hypothetical protein
MPRGARSKAREYQQNMSSRPKMRGHRPMKKHNIKNESQNQVQIELKEYLLSKIKKLEEQELVSDELELVSNQLELVSDQFDEAKEELSYVKEELREQKNEFSRLTQTQRQTSKALEEWKKTGIRFHVLHKEIEKLGGTDNTDVMASLVDLMTDIEVPDYGEKAKYYAGVNSSYEPPSQSSGDLRTFINYLTTLRSPDISITSTGNIMTIMSSEGGFL